MSTIINFKNFKNKHWISLKYLSKYIGENNNNLSIKKIQKGFKNFYNPDSIQPYIARKAKGPWILTDNNEFVYDTGGYGMLGLGHNPPEILDEIKKEHVMANIMTPNLSQHNFWKTIKRDIQPGYHSILCLNSGSEANSLASRLANMHNTKNPVIVSMIGSFHGRTEAPALASHSCREKYQQNLYNYKNKSLPSYFIKMNDSNHAQQIFEQIKKNGEHPELTFFEPVQGEGDPGVMIQPEFYKTIRELTKNANGLLLADSVQAGLRCTGELSVTKYPGFDHLEPPDMETFSKAINGGHYPLSVLAISQQISDKFQVGLYGNTMTSNPKALDVGTAVLNQITPELKKNIVEKGNLMLDKFNLLKDKHSIVERVTGTGLLLAIHLDPKIDVLKVERSLRIKGLNVIHGGKNALRFTPWFYISSEEIDYICDLLDNEFKNLQ